jgi:hypothetical protein
MIRKVRIVVEIEVEDFNEVDEDVLCLMNDHLWTYENVRNVEINVD